MTGPEPSNLVEAWFPYAMSLTARWSRQYPWLGDDFCSEAGLALIKAAERYDGSVPFRIALAVTVRQALGARLASERSKNRAAFRRAGPLVLAGGEEIDPINRIADDGPAPDQAAELADELARLPELLGTLAPDRRAEVELCFLDGTTRVAIGAARGVSYEAVSQNVRASLAKLRAMIGVE